MLKNDSRERTLAINTHDKSIVVTAGAGSGKTTVLVSRYLSLVKRGVRSHAILALTFTNKAAAEMKKRIRKEILEESNGGENGTDIETDLALAPIMTFHAFCSMLLREFAIEAGIDPEFRVLDDSKRAALREKAYVDLLLHPKPEEHTALVHILALYGKSNLSEMLIILEDRIDDYYQTRTFFKQDKRIVLDAWESFLTTVREHVLSAFFDDKNTMQELKAVQTAGQDLDTSDAAVKYFDTIRPYISKITHNTPNDEFLQAIDGIFGETLGTKGSKKVWEEDELKEIKSVNRNLREKLEKVKTGLELGVNPDAAQTKITFEIISDLFTVIDGYFDRFSRDKERTGSVDFTDLIRHTRHFLAANPHLVEQYIRSRYQFIFIDEFQDTDPAQFEIISAIIGTLDETCTGLFIVGDPNQSIYQFRNADVTQFKGVKEIISNDCAGKCLNLSVCFRSTPAVIGCVNYVFSRIFTTDKKPWEFLHENAILSEKRASDVGFIQLLLSGDPAEREDIKLSKQHEARLIAKTLREYLDASDTHKPKDIAILVERRTHLLAYLNALTAEGLSYVVEKGVGFYDLFEIRDLHSILSFICTSHDDCALLAVLRSPYFCFSDRTITLLALYAPAESVWERLCFAADSKNKDDFLTLLGEEEYIRLIHAKKLLSEWIIAGWTQPVHLCVSSVLLTSHIFTVYAALPDGDQKIANVKKFLDIVLERSTHAGYRLIDLVTDIKQSIKEEEREGEAEDIHDNAISVMTVHAAKGLEFPVVVLADLSDNRRTKSPPIFIGSKPEEFGIKTPDPDANSEFVQTPVYTGLHFLYTEKELAESKRLLYVGMTRARDSLILSGLRPKKRYTSISDGKNKMDWLCTAFNIDPDSPRSVRIETNGGAIDIQVQTDDAEVEQQIACVPGQNQLISGEKIHGKRHIDSTSQISTRVHMSMSSLQRKENAKAKEHTPLLPDTKNLKPNEIGTLLHEIFSGIRVETVLRRYGILCEANITACQNHYSRFLQLPELQRVQKEYTELSCCLTVVDQNSPHHYHLQGAIDRLCKTDNGWILIDYKTGEGDPMQFQLVLEAYRRAAEDLVKESVTAYQYNIVSHELVLTDSMEDGLFMSLVAAEGNKLLS